MTLSYEETTPHTTHQGSPTTRGLRKGRSGEEGGWWYPDVGVTGVDPLPLSFIVDEYPYLCCGKRVPDRVSRIESPPIMVLVVTGSKGISGCADSCRGFLWRPHPTLLALRRKLVPIISIRSKGR